MGHELAGLLINIVGVDQQFADFGREVITNGPDHETGFLIDQERARRGAGSAFYCGPQLQQVVQIPLQLFGGAADTRGACDQAHPVRVFELIHGFAQFLAIFAFNPARDTAATRVVRHQHQIAPGQRNERGQRGAFRASLFLVHLNDDFLAFGDRILNAGLGDLDTGLEVRPGDFLEREKAVPFFAVVDEGRFEAGFNPGDDPFVYIAFARLASGRLDIDIDQFLAIDDGNPQLFGMSGVKKHSLHWE